MGSRTKNTKRNIIMGMLYRVIAIVMPFLIRTAILRILGEQYVGLSSLFSSILQVLNLAELGFSSAVVYNMYKPIANGDDATVCALLNYYKKVYRVIGIIILAVGLALMPFLPYLINGDWPNDINIYTLYLLYLLNTVISYFLFAHMRALLNAIQRLDLVNLAQIAVHTLKYILQLAVIAVFHNYYLFVTVAIISSGTVNLFTAYIARRYYPQYICKGAISDSVKKDVRKQVGGIMISKLCDTSRNSFDSIVLSTLFGLSVVGIYNNYYYVYNSIYGIMLVISSSMQASVGNSVVMEKIEKNYQDLKLFQFVFMNITGIASVCMLCLFQPFMDIWAGEKLKLSDLNMILFCVYFYIINMNNMRNLYFNSNGLWWFARYTFVLESLGNLILNIGLGLLMGVTGIILATIITIFVFNFIARTNILFSRYFQISPKEFYLESAYHFVSTAFAGACAYIICGYIAVTGILGLAIRLIISAAIVGIVYFLFFFRRSNFRQAITLIRRLAVRGKHS